MSAFQSHRTQQLKVKKSLIQELDIKNTVADEACNPLKSRSPASSSLFLPLSNASEGVLTSISDSDENRNFFDAIKDSLNSESNTPRESENSDNECADSEDASQKDGPPSKKSKLEEKEEKDAVPEARKYGKRILDDFMLEPESDSPYSSVRVVLHIFTFSTLFLLTLSILNHVELKVM